MSRPGAACGCRAGPSRRSGSSSTGATAEGADYESAAREIVFTRPIVKEAGQRRALDGDVLGLFGTYRKHEAVDVEYRLRREVKLASDAEVLAD